MCILINLGPWAESLLSIQSAGQFYAPGEVGITNWYGNRGAVFRHLGRITSRAVQTLPIGTGRRRHEDDIMGNVLAKLHGHVIRHVVKDGDGSLGMETVGYFSGRREG